MLEPCLPRVLNTKSEAFDTIEVWDDTDIDDEKSALQSLGAWYFVISINYFRIIISTITLFSLQFCFVPFQALFRGIKLGWVEKLQNTNITILNRNTKMKESWRHKVHKFSCWLGASTPCVCKNQKFQFFCWVKHPMVHVKWNIFPTGRAYIDLRLD